MPNQNSFIFNRLRTIITICLIVIIIIFASIKLNQTYNLQYRYEGIKYQSNNLNSGTPVVVEVNGTYKKGYFGNPDIFKGKLIIDGKMCYGIYGDRSRGYEYAFNKYNMSQLESNAFKGHIFISDNFRELTIEIHELESNGVTSFNYNNGWLISAPSNNREQAVNISNKLVQQLHKNVLIE